MAVTAFTNFYNLGQWGYMGVGPTPQAGFELSVAVNDPTQYVGWFVGSGVAKLGILFYKIGDATKYAVHKTAYLSVTNSDGNYMVVGGQYAGVPNSQTVTLSYNASDWEFYGGFTAADLSGAASTTRPSRAAIHRPSHGPMKSQGPALRRQSTERTSS